MNAIETHGLTKLFGDSAAVDKISISVPHGAVYGLLGPNGAGKSTAIKMLTTLAVPTSGSAVVAGYDVVRSPVEVRRRIGYVPQQQSVDPDLTGFENLLVFARLYGIGRKERQERILGALELMNLSDVRDRLVRHYSGGMVRRLEIAQSMLNNPEVLFMDEPTIGLDPLARHTVWERVSRLRESYGTTILMTTHYMDEAEQLCTLVAFIDRGVIQATGAPKELMAQEGPGTTLDDLFIKYTSAPVENAL